MSSPKPYNDIVIEISPAELNSPTAIRSSSGELHEKESQPASSSGGSSQALFHAGDSITLDSFDARSGSWIVAINGQPFKGRLRIAAELEFDVRTFPQTVHDMYKLALSPFTEHSRLRGHKKTLPLNDDHHHHKIHTTREWIGSTPHHHHAHERQSSSGGRVEGNASFSTNSASSGHLSHLVNSGATGQSESTTAASSTGGNHSGLSNSNSGPHATALAPNNVQLPARAMSRDLHRPSSLSSQKLQLVPNSPRAKGEAESLALTKQIVAAEVGEISSALYELRMELRVIVRAYLQEFGGDMSELERLRFPLGKGTPGDLAFSKLLSHPYFNPQRMKSEEEEIKTEGIKQPMLPQTDEIYKAKILEDNVEELALAPAQPFHFRYLISPVFNLNSVSYKDLEMLDTLDFDVLPYQEQADLEYPVLLVFHIFRKLGLIDAFRIPHNTLYRFLKATGYRYRQVPFHNFYHAFNVTQTMYYFLIAGVKTVLSPLEKLAMVIATLCHDCDHPGLNNSFQAKANTRVAFLHKKSTLENHHLLHCLSILAQEECDILVNLTKNEKEAVKLFIRNLILVTDMSLHGVINRRLIDRKRNISKAIRNKESLGEEDRILVMCTVMKCSDLSNEIRPNHMAQKWALRVLQEFFSQAQKERTLSLPVTPFMDSTKIIIAKEQINFIKGLCMPLYEHLIFFFPALSGCVEQMNQNREAWEQRLNNFFNEDPDAKNKLSDISIWAQKGDKGEKVANEKLGLKGILSSRSSEKGAK